MRKNTTQFEHELHLLYLQIKNYWLFLSRVNTLRYHKTMITGIIKSRNPLVCQIWFFIHNDYYKNILLLYFWRSLGSMSPCIITLLLIRITTPISSFHVSPLKLPFSFLCLTYSSFPIKLHQFWIFNTYLCIKSLLFTRKFPGKFLIDMTGTTIFTYLENVVSKWGRTCCS